MKKTVLTLCFFLLLSFAPTAFAQGILPSTDIGEDQCHELLSIPSSALKGIIKEESTVEFPAEYFEATDRPDGEKVTMDDILACAIKTGRFKFWMVPFTILYLIKFLSTLGGLLSILFVIIGGYHFIIGGVMEEKEKGKKTISYALIGFVLSLLAYTIVNLVQLAATS